MTNQPLQLVIRVASEIATDQGMKRSNNEDYAVRHEPNKPDDLAYSGCLYIVADGVGGASQGEKASKYAAEKVLYEYYQHPEVLPAERLSAILPKVGKEILQYTRENGLSRMATTMIAAVIRGNMLTVANVGDSRAYLLREKSAQQISLDHNQVSEMLRSGAISEEEALTSKVRNVLTRSLGGHDKVEADTFENIPLYPGDVIILCSDGLHRYLKNDQQLTDLAQGTPAEISQRLVNFANNSGGADNVTVLVVAISAPNDQHTPAAAAPVREHSKKPNTSETWVPDTYEGSSSLKPAMRNTPVRRRRPKQFSLLAVLFIVLFVIGILALAAAVAMRSMAANRPTATSAATLAASATAEAAVQPPAMDIAGIKTTPESATTVYPAPAACEDDIPIPASNQPEDRESPAARNPVPLEDGDCRCACRHQSLKLKTGVNHARQ
jgi:protein phosphatase